MSAPTGVAVAVIDRPVPNRITRITPPPAALKAKDKIQREIFRTSGFKQSNNAGCQANYRMLMKSAALWAAFFFSLAVHAQAPANMIPGLLKEPDFRLGPLRKIEGLNSAQQKAVEDYIRRVERRNGELRVLVDRNQIVVRSSEALCS